MKLEEILIRKITTDKKRRRNEETALMTKEEEVTKFFQISDFLRREVTETETAVEEAVQAAYSELQSSQFARTHRETLNIATREWKNEAKKLRAPSHWTVYLKKKEINLQLKTDFLRKAAVTADRRMKEKFLVESTVRLSIYSSAAILEETFSTMIAEIALESITDGREAKEAAEKASGKFEFLAAFQLVIFKPRFRIYLLTLEMTNRSNIGVCQYN